MATLTLHSSFSLPVGNSTVDSGTASSRYAISVGSDYDRSRKTVDASGEWMAWESGGDGSSVVSPSAFWILSTVAVLVVFEVAEAGFYQAHRITAGVPFLMSAGGAITSPDASGAGTEGYISSVNIVNDSGVAADVDVFVASIV